MHVVAKLIPNAIYVHECLVCAVPGIIAILVSQKTTIIVPEISLEDVSQETCSPAGFHLPASPTTQASSFPPKEIDYIIGWILNSDFFHHPNI